jgi:hypothetical protein
LQTVEARTVTTLRRLLEDAQLRVDDRPAREEGRALAEDLRGRDWHELLATIGTRMTPAAEVIDRLRELSPRPGDPAITALENHGRAIRRFVELETTGQSSRSLRALTEHLRRPA